MTFEKRDFYADLEFNTFPAHKAGLSLFHNPHKTVYETIEQYYSNDGEDWVSEEERLEAIKHDNVWEIIWFPETPVGSCSLLACNLGVLLEASSK